MDIFLNAAQQIPEYKKLDKYLDDHNTLPALVTAFRIYTRLTLSERSCKSRNFSRCL